MHSDVLTIAQGVFLGNVWMMCLYAAMAAIGEEWPNVAESLGGAVIVFVKLALGLAMIASPLVLLWLFGLIKWPLH